MKELVGVLEFLSSVRKIRNRTYPVESDKEDFIAKMELELNQERCLSEELDLKFVNLQKELDNSQMLLRMSEEKLLETTNRLKELTVNFEQKEFTLNSEKAELESKLITSVQTHEENLKACLKKQEEENLVIINQLEMKLATQSKDRELESQLLRLDLSKAATSLVESQENSRILRTQNGISEFLI